MPLSWFLLYAVALSRFFGLLRGSPGYADSLYQSHFIYSGSSGTAVVTADITVFSLEKKKDRNLAINLKSIMASGQSSACMGSSCAVSWMGSFVILVNYKLPFTPNKKTYYAHTGLWHVYAIFAMNSWFWTAVFLSRDDELTEKLHYSSAVTLRGYSLFLAIIRAFSLRIEAMKVMIVAPLFAFLITHLSYMNFYEFDYVWNTKVCVVVSAIEVAIWAAWAAQRVDPERWKVRVLVAGGAAAMLLQLYDLSPWWEVVDGHTL